MKIQQMSTAQLEQFFQVKIGQGLSQNEVQKKFLEHGANELSEGKQTSSLKLLVNQFKDFMILVLFVAMIISGLLGEMVDAYAIVAIVIINGFLGFFQEKKAEKSLQALKKFAAPKMQVLREGKWEKIFTKEVVVGDIVRFSVGDKISADIRIIEQSALEIEESALTGESLPVPKTAAPIVPTKELGENVNMAFMGTLVTKGSGIGIVSQIGMKTEMGQIAAMLNNEKTGLTPLQARLEHLGKVLIIAALLLTMLVVFIGIYQGNPFYTMIMAGVSLAVAAIPEGLPAIVTVALSLGVQRMIKKKALIRKLPAVETLGCTTVICSDKTGTMTENKMTVTHIWSGNSRWQVSGIGYLPNGTFSALRTEPYHHKALQKLLTFGAVCNQAEIIKKNGKYILEGDPTDGAMLVSAMKAGLTKKFLQTKFKIIKQYPFDSTRKCGSVLVQDEAGHRILITKGAPDVLIEKCVSILWDGREATLNSRYEKYIESELKTLTSLALRTIGVAYKQVAFDETIDEAFNVEKGLIFLGIQAMVDPVRPEVKNAVRKCREAGIKTVMITGDHRNTAVAVATQLGIFAPGEKVITGRNLDQLSESELKDIVENVSVFARVTPEHKLRIVKAFQAKKHVVAMTGDGVNDAPAIKAADIGIAMGNSGTDVAKETASVVLLDDHFATIKVAISEGRNIYENIRKFIRYLLASNVGEILVMLFAMIMGLPLPLLPIQILWINLVTDGLPAMALGLDKPEENVMQRPPRPAKESVFARKLGWKVLSRGFLIGVSTILAFLVVYQNNANNLAYAQTVAFATLILAQLIHVFDCRSEVSIFSRNPFGNMYLILAVLSSIALVLPVIYLPSLQAVFHTVSISLRDWMLIISMASIPTFLLAVNLLGKNSHKKANHIKQDLRK